MATETRISENEYQEIVLAEPDRQWELYEGRLRERPGLTWEHGDVVEMLSHLLGNQLDRRQYRVRINEGRVRRSPSTILIPDLLVVPTRFGQPFRGQPGVLAILSDPLPLVVEVWSRSTGDYDVAEKLAVYQQRGDVEIWRINPYERTLTAWRRMPDGRYEETIHREGVVSPTALPGVEIALATLFDN